MSGTENAELIADAIDWRRYLHRHPELAFSEIETSKYVSSKLRQFGLEVHCGLGGTGVVGTMRRGNGGPTIGLRADMDALPILEQSGTEHSSCAQGVMHACGHDGHTAILLAAAKVCASLPSLAGTVQFIFQPAEESGAGARKMMDDGLFELFPCDAIYSLHNWPALPLGTCAIRSGAMMAALATFEIEIIGQSCHAGMPHQGSDVLVAASHIISAFQAIISRNIDPLAPAVLTVTQIHGGTAWNALPENCLIRGTTRCLDEVTGNKLSERLQEVASTIAASFSCRTHIRYEERLPVTRNDAVESAWLREILSDKRLGLSIVETLPSTGSEDFSFMLQRVPGCYIWLGSGAGSNPEPLHSSRFDFNDDVLPLGVELWTTVVGERLRSMEESKLDLARVRS